MLLFFLSSGLFLGWSLGANDAANVFGTAVGSRMLRFRTAAILCGIFVVLGSIAGAGPAHTLGALGAVNALGGAFTVALSAAVTVYGMTRAKLPVSSTQAIVGAIIGWNLFAGAPTDGTILTKIMGTWVLCPIISGLIAAGLYTLLRPVVHRSGIHLLRQDQLTRYGLILVGAFGSYSLGANNIGAVVGVFMPSQPFADFTIPALGTVSGNTILLAVGGIAIATGVFTYSRRVMETVGSSLLKLSPMAALVVVLAQSLVLFLFASEGLESWLIRMGLPTIPLVPVSSSQAVVGAVVGIAVIKRAKNLSYRTLGAIAGGWVQKPVPSPPAIGKTMPAGKTGTDGNGQLQPAEPKTLPPATPSKTEQPVAEHKKRTGPSPDGPVSPIANSSAIRVLRYAGALPVPDAYT